jgi:hypothetical protein
MAPLLLIAILVAAALAPGCAASPRQRPVSAGPVATGPNTLEFVRAQLEGSWVLQSLTVTAFEGKPVPVGAAGTLTFDRFGNLQVDYQISDDGLVALSKAGIAMPTPTISTKGQAMIEPQSNQIVFVDPAFKGKPYDADLVDLRRNPFALQHRRHYQFANDGTLTLSARYDTGKDAAVGRWKKSS